MLITPAYRELNRQLHQDNEAYGISAALHCQQIAGMLVKEGHRRLLDYGCGKGVLKEGFARHLEENPDDVFAPSLRECDITEYDPAIAGKDALPQGTFDLVMCIDVLEHIEPPLLNAVLANIASLTSRKAVFYIDSEPAEKLLADGRNPHLTQKGAEWWRFRLGKYFQIARCIQVGRKVFAEGWCRRSDVLTLEKRSKLKRKPTPLQFVRLFDEIRAQSARYSDAMNRVESVSLFQGVADKRADTQVAVGVVERAEHLDRFLDQIATHAAKGVLVHFVPTEHHTLAMWKGLLERHFRVGEYKEANDGTGGWVMAGGPMVGVQGLVGVGVVDSEERWQQILAATKRVAQRIERVDPHQMRAVLACYGPSLASTIEQLRAEKAAGAVVFSVSGAHDFLLQHGIVPDYHVECDPRAHKTANIEAAHPDVQYLIASCCHPSLFDKLEGSQVYLWHVASVEHLYRLVDELKEPGDTVISGGGSVGLRAIPLLYQIGFRDFSIYGMDCSFSDDGEHQWAGKHAGKRQDLCECAVPQPDGDARVFTTSPVLLTYATSFWETVQKIDDCQFRLAGTGLLQSMAHLYNSAIPLQLMATPKKAA